MLLAATLAFLFSFSCFFFLIADIRTVPVGDVLVGDAGGDIEHDDTALAVDVVAVAKTTELLLSSGVPDIELDLTKVLGCVLVAVCLRIVRLAGWRVCVR